MIQLSRQRMSGVVIPTCSPAQKKESLALQQLKQPCIAEGDVLLLQRGLKDRQITGRPTALRSSSWNRCFKPLLHKVMEEKFQQGGLAHHSPHLLFRKLVLSAQIYT